MPQQGVQQAVNSLTGGLITEASRLNFPANASVDELNCFLETDGTRTRRKGIQLEDGHVNSSFEVPENSLVYTSTWFSVGDQGNLEFSVIQVNNFIYFYRKGVVPVSRQEKDFFIDLNDFRISTNSDLTEEKIQTSSVNGFLIIVHPDTDAILVEYDVETDDISTSVINPKQRDFAYQETTRSFEDEFPENEQEDRPAVANKYLYDLYNIGWSDKEIDIYKSSKNNALPPRNLPWFSGKTAAGSFSVNSFEQIFAGNTRAPNGHFIVDVFDIDRSEASGIDGLRRETTSKRFTTTESFAGRAWYAGLGNSKIYFSVVVEDSADFELCYQRSDPTSEGVSDLVDSDGGVITIQEAATIRKLYAFNSSLLVFADNGVWEIQGVDNVFKATEFSVRKVSNTGLVTSSSFVDASGIPFWWSKTGISTITQDQVSQAASEQTISFNTIQKFWNNIPASSKIRVIGEYDDLNKQVFWFYSDVGNQQYNYNSALIFDLKYSAFFPWRFSTNLTTPFIVGTSFFNDLSSGSQETAIVVQNDLVTINGDSVVLTQNDVIEFGTTEIKFFVVNPVNNKLTVATLVDNSYQDWGELNYSSYIEPAPSFMGDLLTKKSVIYLVSYFERTETGFTQVGDKFEFTNPSSCIVKNYWDFSPNPSSTQQAYKYPRLPVATDASVTFPSEVIRTQLSLRGRGEVLSLRYEAEDGKDFRLLGFEVSGFKNNAI